MLKLFSHYAENEITYVQKYNKIRIKARKDTDKIIMLSVFLVFSTRIAFLFLPYILVFKAVGSAFISR